MPLQLQLSYSNSNDGSDCKNIVIDDSTGDFSSPDNEGGYGTSNPERNTLALYHILTKKNPEATDSDLTYTNEDSAADTVASWTIPVSTDGWYRAQSIAIPIWDAGTAYAQDQLVWFSDALYRSNTVTSNGESPASQPAKWVAFDSTITNLRDVYDNPIAYGPTITIFTTYLDFLQHCLGDEIYADAWKDVSDDRPSFYSTDAATAITALLEGSKIAAARENFQEADRKILIVQDLGNNPNCKNC